MKLSTRTDPQDPADELIAQNDAATADDYNEVDFCNIYSGSSLVTPSVRTRFSLVREVPAPSKDSIVQEYRMGKRAAAGEKVALLYFECTSKKFYMGAGATVLVHGYSRIYNEVTVSEDVARQDNLRIIYESSRALSKLLGCKSNAELPAAFTMPPKA
ncbi:hypothetical protein ACWD25_14825 [Streptomyces sp. NPDC002920]